MKADDHDFIVLWNSSKRIDQIASIMARGRRWCTDRAEILRARGIEMIDKRQSPLMIPFDVDDHEAELLTIWVAFECQTNADEIRCHRRYRNKTQRARRVLAAALYELGFCNRQIAHWMGKRGRGTHTCAVFWRTKATAGDIADAMKALGQCGLPFRRTQWALANQADRMAA